MHSEISLTADMNFQFTKAVEAKCSLKATVKWKQSYQLLAIKKYNVCVLINEDRSMKAEYGGTCMAETLLDFQLEIYTNEMTDV